MLDAQAQNLIMSLVAELHQLSRTVKDVALKIDGVLDILDYGA